MKRAVSIIILIGCVVLLASCGGRSGSHVVVAGSTSVQPYIEILSEEYKRLYNLTVDVSGGGSSAGIIAAANGTADIGMSSRGLSEAEQEYWHVVIAKDGLALIVHPENPVGNLTLQQICDIYTGKATNWSEFGGNDSRIHIISREEGSGTRAAFEDMVMGDEYIIQKAIVQNSNGAVRQLVTGDRNAIGFISVGLVDGMYGLSPVKALSIDGVSPTQENVKNGSYSLYRPFYFVSRNEPAGSVKHLVDFVLSEEGQRILSEEGLVSLFEDSDNTSLQEHGEK